MSAGERVAQAAGMRTLIIVVLVLVAVVLVGVIVTGAAFLFQPEVVTTF